MPKRTIILLAIGLVIIIALSLFFIFSTPSKPSVSNYKECIAAGYPVVFSYPGKCSANGKEYVDDIGNELEKMDLIVVNSPRPNDVITSPLTVTGKARGTWFFEADFPVRLYDGDGNEIAVGIATAQGEWMTEEFVAFTATITFEVPTTDVGELILEKNNPSDLPENSDELRIPVRYR